tara:strand:- start:198 stop:383 length:186 start_codon:yes stop_codon:yes gene_type:complete
MSAKAPKVLLAIVSMTTVCGVTYVHRRQSKERAEMYEGVKRDLERQRLQREAQRENQVNGR